MPSSRRRRAPPEPAASLPVARVAVDVSLAHLDRPFDYLVPAEYDETAVVGARVRVRFAGRLVDGFVLDRVAESEHGGKLAYLAGAPSAEPVLSPETARLARAVADHDAGTMADVLRLAVPPRHARVERQAAQPDSGAGAPPRPEADSWKRYAAGPAFLDALASGGAPRAVWAALPGPSWADEIAAAVQATLASGRGVVVAAPDARDVDRLDAALTGVLGPGRHVLLTADLGPAERYRRWLAVRRGAVRAVVGTRAASFAPVADLGLAVVWDDGDDLHAEPRAPYPHARDVLVLRAHLARAAALIGGFAVSAEGAALVERGWARALGPDRAALHATTPRVEAVGDEARASDPVARAARLPSAAWRIARDALAAGAPVLVQVPRRGDRSALGCAACRARARCPSCGGPLGRLGAAEAPACRWCGRPVADWRCPECGGQRLRANVVGERRTAEELGRAFPRVQVRTSRGGEALSEVGAQPALVVATPGAEPAADGGYGAALLLDGWALLTRADLRAGEETFRRWANAAALVRRGGPVAVVADAGAVPVQALIRWAPGWLAERELTERAELGFPPAVRMAAVDGDAAAVKALLAAADLPAGAQALGPVPAGDGERVLVRVVPADGAALARSLQQAQAARSARKEGGGVRVRMDPRELG
jgi:primosomal protein N' (replication factor Y)